MFPHVDVWLKLLLAAVAALVIAYSMTPTVKHFAELVGAIDVPKDERRVHKHPIPRMGGLAIFLGFVLSMLLFAEMNSQVVGMMIGAVLIVVMGAVDDIINLNAWAKLAVQIVAAGIAIRSGVVFDAISNPNFLSEITTIQIGYLSVPLTVLWIVGCTNAVNLIDGLDGLAVGVSAISSFTMLVVAIFVAEPNTAVILAALTGACIGFMPYNLNPAKIFMGDVGSQFLGYILSTASIIGMFKFHAIITFLVPLLALAVPLTDTVTAFFRRISHGQSPFHADKKHLHHRLLAMGLNQKQAVAVLYSVSAVLGLIAVLLAGTNIYVRASCLVLAAAISIAAWFFIFRHNPNLHIEHPSHHAEDRPHDDDDDTDKAS